MSIWEEPPHKKKRMTDFAWPPPLFLAGGLSLDASKGCGIPKGSPANPVADAIRKALRWSMDLCLERDMLSLYLSYFLVKPILTC